MPVAPPPPPPPTVDPSLLDGLQARVDQLSEQLAEEQAARLREQAKVRPAAPRPPRAGPGPPARRRAASGRGQVRKYREKLGEYSSLRAEHGSALAEQRATARKLEQAHEEDRCELAELRDENQALRAAK